MDCKQRKKRYKCDDCSSAFTTTAHLKDHKASVHSELRPFQCEHCDFSAKLQGSLTQHYATHFPQIYKTQSCPYCPYKCIKPGQLVTHLRVHTKEKPFACKLCPYKASVKTCLTAHMRSHTGEKPFRCSLCTSTFSQQNNLSRHKLFVHSKTDVCLIPCSFPACPQEFAFKYALRRHVESFHNKERRFYCPYCQKSFYDKPHCAKHIRQRHTKERPFKCSVCEYAATTSNDVKKHEKNTHGEYMAVECRICHRKYKNKQSLSTHHAYYHKNVDRSEDAAPKWICKESGCSKEYKTHQGLKQHVNSFHLQQRPFKCLYCEHRTTTHGALNAHLKTHTREKPYCCDLCKRRFISSGDLSNHKATAHSELRPFQCDRCSYSAKTKYGLKQHKKIHEPMPTTFECHICKERRGSEKRRSYSFRTKARLNSHTRTMHSSEANLKYSLPCGGAKRVIISKTKPRCTKVTKSTGDDCLPCFVRLVKIKELKKGPLCETTLTIYG